MRIQIIQVGKNKDSWIESAVGDLLKRCKPFADVEFVTVKDSVVTKTFTKEMVMKEESEAILKALKDGFKIVVLDEKGKQLSSREFAEFLGERKDGGESVCFVIGGAFGLSEEVRKRAHLLVSFSKMTFTHQMIRVFLLEQIYRGFSIINGKEYHHD